MRRDPSVQWTSRVQSSINTSGLVHYGLNTFSPRAVVLGDIRTVRQGSHGFFARQVDLMFEADDSSEIDWQHSPLDTDVLTHEEPHLEGLFCTWLTETFRTYSDHGVYARDNVIHRQRDSPVLFPYMHDRCRTDLDQGVIAQEEVSPVPAFLMGRTEINHRVPSLNVLAVFRSEKGCCFFLFVQKLHLVPLRVSQLGSSFW